MQLVRLLRQAEHGLTAHLDHLGRHPLHGSAAKPRVTLFFAASNGKQRASVVIGQGATFQQAWNAGKKALIKVTAADKLNITWLRVEIVDQVEKVDWATLKARFAKTKTNYFKQGVAWDAGFKVALLEQELVGHACLYTGDITCCTPDDTNLRKLLKRRFRVDRGWPTKDDEHLWLFTTLGIFCDSQEVVPLAHEGRMSGIRAVGTQDAELVLHAIHRSSDYLMRQVRDDGNWDYGWNPCFDRPVKGYNTLRHASSAYALLEGWEITQEPSQLAAVERALAALARNFIKPVEPQDGRPCSYLVDQQNEIKLGGNAVALLAYSKYRTLTDVTVYDNLMQQLAEGLLRMQDAADGSFVHVLHYPSLEIKEQTRTVYYDGEAAFGLLRLYALTRETRLLAAVEKAVDNFITREHWRAHDHWLGYCVNELTIFRPESRYFQFGLDNVKGHLDFVLNRITTYPTLLELMLAAHYMIERMGSTAEGRELIDRNIDILKFYQALHHRARYIFNGYFFPELAMFFAKPDRIVESFFIRHFSFRVRIDDVQHYLSGLVHYWRIIHTRDNLHKLNSNSKTRNLVS